MSPYHPSDHLHTDHATVRIVPVQISNSHNNYNRQTQWRLTPLRLCLALLLLMLVVVGCGPRNSESNSDLSADVVRIAQDFQKSGDVGSARAELAKLDVANPTQFLIYLAEERAGSAPGTPETTALVQFALALGLQSNELMQYAMQNGLLPTRVPTATSVAIAQLPAQPAAPANNAPAAPAVPVAVVVTKTAPAASNVVSDSSSLNASALTPTAGAQATTQDSSAANDSATATTQQQSGSVALPTATPQPPAATSVTKPQVQASNGMNVRGGPGTDYPVVGALNDGEAADIVAKNPAGDWWEVSLTTGGTGWVYGALVKTAGNTAEIAVASDIPPAPPTATPAPVAEVPTAAPPPAEQPPAADAQPTAAPPPATSGNDFILVEKRLWGVVENGGTVDAGGSVKCGLKRELHVIVLDANGNPLNGVAVQAIYGAQEIYVTGSQGKGDGQSEFVLGAGQGVKVVRDTDGHDVTSDVADGLITHSPDIPHADLIAAGYCHDDASCDTFNKSAGCWGHHSWTVTFKRRY
jgi:hypothetical protein